MSLVYSWNWEVTQKPDKFKGYDWNKVKKAILNNKCTDKHADKFLGTLASKMTLVTSALNDIGFAARQKLLTPKPVIEKMFAIGKRLEELKKIEANRKTLDAGQKAERLKLEVAKKALGAPIIVITVPQFAIYFKGFDCSVHLKSGTLEFRLDHNGKGVKFSVPPPT